MKTSNPADSEKPFPPLKIITRYTGRLIGGFICVLFVSIVFMVLGNSNMRMFAIFTCFGYIVALIVAFWAARRAEEEMLVYLVRSPLSPSPEQP